MKLNSLTAQGPRLTALLAIAAAWIGAAALLAQPVPSAPATPAADTLHRIEHVPNGGIAVTTDGAVLQHTEYHGYAGPGEAGRCVMVFARNVTLFDQRYVEGNDDRLGFVGDTRGSVAMKGHCVGGVTSKSLIAYTNPLASNRPGPILGAAEGYAATLYDYTLDGATRIVGGIYNFNRCRFLIGPLGAIQALDARLNFTDCEWIAVLERAPAPDWPYSYWYQRGADGVLDPCGVRVTALVDGQQAATPLASRLHFANCRLRIFQTWSDLAAWRAGKDVPHQVIAADGPAGGQLLCRRYPNAADTKAGRTAYGPKGSVPTSVFVKEPLSK